MSMTDDITDLAGSDDGEGFIAIVVHVDTIAVTVRGDTTPLGDPGKVVTLTLETADFLDWIKAVSEVCGSVTTERPIQALISRHTMGVEYTPHDTKRG